MPPIAAISSADLRSFLESRPLETMVAGTYDEDDLRSFLDERLAKYKRPRSIVVIDALPLTAIGKVDKKILEAWEDQE